MDDATEPAATPAPVTMPPGADPVLSAVVGLVVAMPHLAADPGMPALVAALQGAIDGTAQPRVPWRRFHPAVGPVPASAAVRFHPAVGYRC